MASDKGKQRAISDDDPEKDDQGVSQNSNEQSLAARIAASASGLVRTFAASNQSEVSSAAASASSGKSQPSVSGHHGHEVVSESSYKPSLGSSQSSGPGFRAAQIDQHVMQSENDFSEFLDGIDAFVPSEGFGSQAPHLNSKFDKAWVRSQISSSSTTSQYLQVAVQEQELRDGEDVLALLSGPGAIEEDFEAPSVDDENYDWNLTPDQILKIREMTRDVLAPPATHTGISPDNPLNLIADLSNDSIETRENWRVQWEGVLTRYADEVWGGLLPLVQEARVEIKEAKDSEDTAFGGGKPKALRRLEAILGHFQNQ